MKRRRMTYGSFGVAVAAVLATVAVARQPQITAMPLEVQTNICGSMLPDDPDPWGHLCDSSNACTGCFFSGSSCFGCTAPRNYNLCGTPAEVVCSNSAITVDCGNTMKYQAAGSASECMTCIGAGSMQGNCTKNSCGN